VSFNFPGGAAAMLIGDEGDRSDMAEYGEWNRKGAVLSDVTAQKEYGVTRDFIVKGVQAGELEFRERVVWGKALPKRTCGGGGYTPPWRERQNSSQPDLARVAQKTVVVVRQSRHPEPHDFLCKQICSALLKRPHRPPRQCQGNDDAILVRAQAIMSVEQPGEVSARRPPVVGRRL
jgi:hypothetical protein